jgi:hypothetical protein
MDKKKKNPRIYNCKDEELPVIGGYVLTSIRRDLEQFASYSPKYNDEWFSAFEQLINKVENLVNPKSETAQMKLITGRLYTAMDELENTAKRIEGYIRMSKGEVPISTKDFGIFALKQRVRARDAEGTVQNARLMNASISRYRVELTKQGLSDEAAEKFAANIEAVSADNRLQYDMLNNRKAIVQANLDAFNDLADQIKEICINGKILFEGNAEKLKEYTFNELRKRVRNTGSSRKNADHGDENTDESGE